MGRMMRLNSVYCQCVSRPVGKYVNTSFFGLIFLRICTGSTPRAERVTKRHSWPVNSPMGETGSPGVGPMKRKRCRAMFVETKAYVRRSRLMCRCWLRLGIDVSGERYHRDALQKSESEMSREVFLQYGCIVILKQNINEVWSNQANVS
jgi:hypothetical protein